MFENIKNLQNHPRIKQFTGQLNDVRAVGLLIFLVVVLLISWSGAKVIQTNYTLQKQISELQQENQVQKLENNNLQLQNEYFNTNQYLELSARQNFGLGKPGETEVIVPTSIALKHAPPLQTETKTASPTSKQPFYQSNFEAWINFFLHRQGIKS
jgi:cell division protein FtsL